MYKRLFFILFLSLISGSVFCQLVQSRHHFFNSSQRARVVDKKYNLIDDSAYVTFEFLAGNTNAWNGDVYNQYPSVQFIGAIDNNVNFEIGTFICLPTTVFNGLNPAGADIYGSYKLYKNLYIIADIYNFIGYHYDLVNEMGYDSKVYNMYTLRLQYDINDQISIHTGYSILNDRQNLQQSLFAEFDYNLTKNIPIVFGYASDANINKLSWSFIYTGLGYKCAIINTKSFKLNLLAVLNPLYAGQIKTNWPLTILLSTDF